MVKDTPKMQRFFKLAQVFTPSAPVASRSFFAGRVEQILEVTTAIAQPGRHVMLYGERGVGKTSLANILQEILEPVSPDFGNAVRINCSTQDTFRTVWVKVLEAAGQDVPDSWDHGTPDPDSVRVQLQRFPKPIVVILDEYDRVEDDESLSLMADLIKSLSDHLVPTKLVVVGVADSIDQLFGEHQSIQRAVQEVRMPRMSQPELADIVDTGLKAVGMEIEDVARQRISRLSEGFPHYVHLLSLYAGQNAVADDRLIVTKGDVSAAINQAIEKHSLVREYQMAIQSPRPGTLFSRVLAACALAEKNRLGQFTASAVREPMTKIMGRPYEIPAFATHLKAFTEIDRGCVLRREGTERRYTYRFNNPLLQSFSILTSLAEGEIPEDYAAEIFD
ncbi:AAA family ATPase [Streptomyces sp. NPDC006339]|uniref:AAA family ATPase n=1 Tax=Streptomyces sp. NPDC006339 TaxID=3156755 RepID=UPI0033A637F3